MSKQNWRERHADKLADSIDLETVEITKAILAGEMDVDVACNTKHISLADILHEIDVAGGPGPNFHYEGGLSQLRKDVANGDI